MSQTTKNLRILYILENVFQVVQEKFKINFKEIAEDYEQQAVQVFGKGISDDELRKVI